jgi:tRNA A-37 threonylcarbamoyl transferase component Bud32
VSTGQLERVLKHGLRRSVRLERAADGARTVVKRFASRGFAAASLDRARAAREHRMLAELHERGLAVPRPLACERVDGGWEVRMEWLGESASAAELLAGSATWPSGRRAGLHAFAKLLGALHSAGVDHADLHNGNALLDAHGRAFAIDFHKARRVKSLRERTLLRDLAKLCAGAREVTTPRERARFLLAWRAALPPALRPTGSLARLAATLEERARTERVEYVHKRRARWLREGTACAAVDGDFRGFLRHGVDRERIARLGRTALARGAGEFAGLAEPDVLLVTGASERVVRRIWCCAARLEEHGLPAPRPLALSLEPRPWVALAVPPHALPATVPQALRSLRSLHSLGALCAGLFDRGLRPGLGIGPLFWLTPRGEVLLGSLGSLKPERRPPSGLDAVRALSLAGLSISDLSRRERAAFAAGLLAGSRLEGGARRALSVELRHG